MLEQLFTRLKTAAGRALIIFIYRSRVNIWLGRIVYKNYNGFIANAVGLYCWSRDARASKSNGLAVKDSIEADALRKDGFLFLKNKSDLAVITEISRQWSQYANMQQMPHSGRLELSSADRSKVADKFIPLLDKLITAEVDQTLEAFFQSHYRIVNFHLYRNRMPERISSSDAFGATGSWHTDASTCDSLKLFFLLSDVTPKNGPMEVMNRQETQKLYRAGAFYFPDNEGRTHNYAVANCKVQSLQGPAGSSYYALTNEVLHRATIPKRNEHRDLLVFYIIAAPHKQPTRQQLLKAVHREIVGFKRFLL